MSHPERYEIAPGLNISRALTGLWQVADIERKQGLLDPEMGADNLQRYVDARFDTFDMADHYGSDDWEEKVDDCPHVFLLPSPHPDL